MTAKWITCLKNLWFCCCLGVGVHAYAMPLPEADTSRSAPEEISIVVVHDENGLSTVPARLWRAAGPVRAGILFVTGVDGGFGEPVDEIYSRMAPVLAKQGVTSVFVSYRYPGEIDSSVEDALAGAAFLRKQGVKKMAVIGWSFGGAVAIHSATHIPETATVIGIASQARDTESIHQFQEQSLLILHSEQDENVPFDSATAILEAAPPQIRKAFLPLEQGDHHLTGLSSMIAPLMEDWLKKELGL